MVVTFPSGLMMAGAVKNYRVFECVILCVCVSVYVHNVIGLHSPDILRKKEATVDQDSILV